MPKAGCGPTCWPTCATTTSATRASTRPRTSNRCSRPNGPPQTVRVQIPYDALWAADFFAEQVRNVADDAVGATLELDLLPPVAQRVGLLLLAAGEEARVLEPAGLIAAGPDAGCRPACAPPERTCLTSTPGEALATVGHRTGLLSAASFHSRSGQIASPHRVPSTNVPGQDIKGDQCRLGSSARRSADRPSTHFDGLYPRQGDTTLWHRSPSSFPTTSPASLPVATSRSTDSKAGRSGIAGIFVSTLTRLGRGDRRAGIYLHVDPRPAPSPPPPGVVRWSRPQVASGSRRAPLDRPRSRLSSP